MTVIQSYGRNTDFSYEKLKDIMTIEKPDKNGEILTVKISLWLRSYDLNEFYNTGP